MSRLDSLLPLVSSGDIVSLEELSVRGALEGFCEAEKKEITLSAARAGQASLLRSLFQRWHLYSAEPDSQGRTVLHHAALSGDAETVRFAMDVLGFDPLAGDVRGITALDCAHSAPSQEAYDWMVRRLGFTLEACYRNPLLRGFHPDPSVVRVKEDYYLVNSSFAFFPGLPVYHSRDLVHWKLIGHAAEQLESSGLGGLPGGVGYWAPDISWFRGRFWVVATLRRNTVPYRLQMITSAAEPQGPWAPPKFLPLDGIDPSLFTDEDGRRYILLNPGAVIAELDAEGNLISDPEMISFGCARIKPEGPHLLKKDGWYYLFLAEGGTGPDHMETVLRSRTLKGPYEPCPFNPILSRKNPFSPVGRSGHGKLVSTPDGRWFMVYLCGRSVEMHTVMGRETALDPVSWTPDGWPQVNALRGPSCLQHLPFPDQAPEAAPSSPADSRDWISPRADFRDFACFNAAGVTLTCGADPSEIKETSLLLLRQEESDFYLTTRVDLSGASEGAMAGLAGYYDERSFFLFGLRKLAGGSRLEVIEQIGNERKKKVFSVLESSDALLSVEGNGLKRSLYLVRSGSEKELVCSFVADYLSDEGLTGGKRFTGAALGLAAVGEGKAAFSSFRLSFSDPLESFLIQSPVL